MLYEALLLHLKQFGLLDFSSQDYLPSSKALQLGCHDFSNMPAKKLEICAKKNYFKIYRKFFFEKIQLLTTFEVFRNMVVMVPQQRLLGIKSYFHGKNAPRSFHVKSPRAPRDTFSDLFETFA